MVSEYEAAKVRREMFHEMDGASRAAVAKCAAGLAIVSLIALIGTSAPPQTGQEIASAGTASAYQVAPARE
jgi:hypothetical protein